jgi:hypothetical protein
MARVRLGRNKQDYPLTGIWKTSKSKDGLKIDYKQLEDETLDLDNFGSRQKISGTIEIETQTPRNYLVKDIIVLADGTEYIINSITRHIKERESKKLSMYVKLRIETYKLTLGTK